MRWNFQLGVVPIPKANKEEHRAENLDVFDFELAEADMARLNDLNRFASALGQRVQYT